MLCSGRRRLSAQAQEMMLCGSVADRGSYSKLLQLLMGWGPLWYLGQDLPDIVTWGLNSPQQQPLQYLQDASLLFKLLGQEGLGRLWLRLLSPTDRSAEGNACGRTVVCPSEAREVPCPVGTSVLGGQSSAVLLWSFTQQSSFPWHSSRLKHPWYVRH